MAEGELVRAAPRTFALPCAADDLTPLAATLLAYPAAVASHRAAAWLWRLDGVETCWRDVTVPARINLRGACVHRTKDLEEFEVREVEGLRVTDPTRTLCDLGAVCEADVVEQALESALRRGLTSVKRLEWRMHGLTRPGRRGPSVLREVLRQRSASAPPTESELETRYLQVLHVHGVPEPVRQHRVWHDGRCLGRVDLAYPDQRIFVELDGWETHGTRHAFQHDRARQNDLVIAHWSPLRFTWHDVTEEPEQTADRTLRVLRWSSSSSPFAAGLS